MDQSLLTWGLANATPGSLIPLAADIKAGKRPDLNTDMLKAIMGTTDADRMKECVQVIEGKWVDRDGGGLTDKDVTVQDQLRAWDDLEMLVEDLDNANDLKFLALWKPILKHVTDPDDEIALRACWVCGTAVQNNPRAQDAFLELDPLPIILPLVTSTIISAEVRSKAMYCLSSTLKNSEPAVTRFSALDGLATLTASLQDPSLSLRTKTAFLLSQLVSQSASPPALATFLRSSSILSTLLSSLSPATHLPTGPNADVTEIDPDYRDKTLRVFVNLVQRTEGTGLEKDERERLLVVVEEIEKEKEWSVDELGMAQEEWEEFKKALKA